MFNLAIPPSPVLKITRSGLSGLPSTASSQGSPAFGGAPEGADHYEFCSVPGQGTLIFDSNGVARVVPINTCTDVFNLLPGTAAAAGKDDMLLSLGTATEVVARATKGGINLKTQSSTPAQNDNVMVIPVASSTMLVPIATATQARVTARVNLTQATGLIFSMGFDENLTSPDKTATAGDGIDICFDPGNAMSTTTGLPAASLPNFILHQKIAGVDVFSDSGIAVNAGQEYDLAVWWDVGRIPHFAINGVEIAWAGAAALTANTGTSPVGVVIGEQISTATPAGQYDMDLRFVRVERFIG
jgi:hypothetical protein